MSVYKLVDQALVGTARQGAEPPLLPGVRELAQALPAELDSARRLLLIAGLDAIYRAAGFLPPRLELPSPAEDQRPAPSRRAEAVLGEIQAFGHQDLLFRALDWVDRAGLRWPAGLLPSLLDLGQKTFAGQHVLLLRVLDGRGRWLAAQRAEWSWALPAASVFASGGEAQGDAWQVGAIEERVAALTRWREREPAAARESLEAAFKQDKPEARAALLIALRAGISMDDAAFVESCLKDRSQQVREVAKELLLHLPQSEASRRAVEWVLALVRREKEGAAKSGGLLPSFKGLLGGEPAAKITIELPDDAPKEWEEEGIATKPPSGVGAKAFWLTQLVAAVPPRLFCREWALGPAELIAEFAAHEWAESLLIGIARSAAALGDVELAIHLIPVLGAPSKTETAVWHQGRAGLIRTLFPSLPAAERLRQAVSWLDKGLPAWVLTGGDMLPQDFGSEQGRTFVQALQRAVHAYSRTWNPCFVAFLPHAATGLPLELAASLELPDLSENDRARYHYQGPRKKYLEILHLRQRLAQEIPL